MDEQVIDDLYNRAVSKGYGKTRDEFVKLLHSDNDVFNDMYSYVKEKGYRKSTDDFSVLVGKKKDGTNSQLPLVSGLQGSAPMEELAVSNMGITGLQKVKKPVPVATPMQAETPKATPLQTKAPQFVTDLTSNITPEEISKQEETLVPEMNYKYGPLGFKFEEAGYTGNYMKVVAPNGKDAIEVSLGLGSMDKKGEAEKLKRFIEENSNTVSTGKLLAVEQEYKNNKKVYNSQKEIDETVKNLNKEAEGLMAAQKVWAKQQDEYNVQVDKFNKVPVSERTTPQYKQQYDALIKQRNELDAKRVELTSGLDDITYKEETLKESVGRYTEMESQKGAWYETVPMALARGAGKLASGFYGEAMDLINEFGPRDMLGVNDEWWEKQSLKSAKKLGYGEPSEGQNATQFLYNLPSQQKSNVEADVRDVLKKRDKGFMVGGEANSPQYLAEKFIELASKKGIEGPKSRTDEGYVSWLNTLSDDVKDEIDVEVKKQAQGGQTISEVLRNTLSDVLPTVSTKDYYEKTQQKYVPGAILGAIESVPSFFGGNKFTRLARLFAQADDATFAEMEKDPDFKDISENEKRLISTPISIATAILEEVGFRNIISNKGLLNRVTLAALRKSGATTTAKTFGELVRNEVDGMVAKGALTLVGASLAEAETGALQQVAEIAVKEIYNEVKDKKMFNTPESVGEFVADVVKAGVQEAIGGFVLGTPSAVGAAYTKKGFLNMSDEQFRQFESMANDGKLQTAFVTSLKNKILNGEISRSEAKEQLNNYRNSVSLYNQLPDDLSLQGKKEAMNLIREKNALNQQIENKDAALVVNQKERIAAIDAELGEISNTKSVTNFNEEETVKLAGILLQEKKRQEDVKNYNRKELLGRDVRLGALEFYKSGLARFEKWEGRFDEYSDEEIEDITNEHKTRISLLERSLNGSKPITLNQITDNAIQEQGTATSVPSTEQPQLGLQEVGEGNAQPQGTPPGTQEVVAPEPGQEEVVVPEQGVTIQDESNYLSQTLGVETNDADVLALLYNSSLTSDEKKILFRQWKQGVMSLADIKRYTTLDLDKVNKGDIDKWAAVQLSNNRRGQIDAENISFEEVVPVVEPEREMTEREEESKRYDLSEKVFAARRAIGRATDSDADAAMEEYNEAKKELADFETGVEERKDKRRAKTNVKNLIESENDIAERAGYEYTDLYQQDPRLAALQSAKDMVEFAQSEDAIAARIAQGQSAEEAKKSGERVLAYSKRDIADLEADLQANPVVSSTTQPAAEVAPSTTTETATITAPEILSEPVVEEEPAAEYEPVKVEDTSHDTFTKDNATDYEEDEREGDNGRTYPYLSMVKVPLYDADGNTIGYLVKLVDDDKELSWKAEDIDQNELPAEYYDTKGEARKAIVDDYNKKQKKEFDKQAKKAAAQKIKDAAKAAEKAAKAAEKAAKAAAKAALDAEIATRRDELPDYQNDTNTEATKKILDYFAEVLGIPKFTEDLSRRTYTSWLNNTWVQGSPLFGRSVSDKLHHPKKAFNVITKYKQELDRQARTAPITITTAPTTTAPVAEAPVVTVEEEVKQLEELFPEETQEPAVEGTEEAPQTTQEGVSVTGPELDALKSRVKDAVKLKIIQAAQRAAKTLKSLFPNIEIVVHETEASYNAYMDKVQLERGGAGTFSYSGDDNGATVARIDINLSKANARTVAHEATHAVLLKTFGDNVELFKKFQKRISSILSEGTNKELLKFANRYVDSNGNLLDVAYEEYLAELNAVLAENGSSMPVTMLQKIAALINKVVSTATNGLFTPFQNTKDTKDLIDFFNAASKTIREGGAFNNLNNLGVAGVLNTSGIRSKKSITDTYEKYHVAPQSGHTKIDVKGNEPIVKGQTFGTVTYSNKEEGDVVADSFSINDIDKLSNRSSGFITTARNIAQGFISIKPSPKDITEQLFGDKKSYKNLSDTRKKQVDKERIKQTTQFKLPFSNSKALESLNAYINKNKDKKPSDYYNVVKQKSKDIINSFKEEVKNNLRALYNNVSEDFRETSRQWYDGANRLAQGISKSYGISLEQSAGILAALSPKNNWFNNISAAERVIRAWADHQNTTVTKEMVDRTIAYMERNGEAPFAKDIRAVFSDTKGTPISELVEQYKKTNDPKILTQIGITMRIIDQSEYSPIVYSVSPEGFIDGKYGVIGWSGGAALTNAVSMLIDPSMNNISSRLGNGNKVRNFYGNIIDPQNADFLTADTHAFAAGLMLPASANEAQDFGLFDGGMSVEYAIFKDAYIEVAKEFGILPRELQSITWEAVRGSINTDNRTPSMVKDINKISEELLTNGESNENRTNEILKKYPIKFTKGEWSNKRGIEAQKRVLGSNEGVSQAADTGGSTKVLGDLRGQDTQLGGAASGTQAPSIVKPSNTTIEIKGKSQKVFRGSGRNMGSGVNEGFNWVSSSREVAEDFGDVTELEIPTPQKTYKFPWARTSQPITGDQLVNAVNNAIIKAIKEKTLTESQYRAINEKKKLLSTLIDNKIDSFQSKVNDPKSSKLLAEIFSDLGYDALEVNDGGITNYGLIKATPNNIKAKSQKSEITFERGVGRKSIKVNLNNIEVTPVREVNFEDVSRWHTFEITHEGEKLGSIDLKRKGDDVKIALSVIFSPKDNGKSFIDIIKTALNKIITKVFKGKKGAFIITKTNQGKGIGTVAYTKLAEMLQQEYGKKLISDSTRSDAAEALWRSFERKGLAKVVGNRDSSQYNWEYYYEFIVKPTPTSNIKGKFQLTTVEKITNIINQARGRGFSEASIAIFLKNKGYSTADITSAMSVAGATPTLNEQTNPGFDALMQKVDKRIAKMRSQTSTATEAQIITAIDTIIRNSPLYATLNDQQKKFLELEGRNRTNARERRAPSIGRVLGVLSDITNISRAEKLLVIKRIRDLSKDAAKNLAMELRNMASTGTITLPQAANVLARFGKVNLLNEVSVANFVDYMARVFADAEYAAKMKYAKSMLASAKKNVTSKIGIADGLITPLMKLFSVNPSIIPESVLDKYISLVKMFGEKAAVLTLREKYAVLTEVNDILQILDQEQSLVDTLLDVVEQYQNKEFDANGNLDLEKTIKNMIDDGTITEDDAAIMRKYRTTFVPRASTKKTQQELDDEKNELLDALDNITVDGSGLTTRDERKLANEIGELIKTSAVRSLSNTELKNLLKVIDNINNNYIPHYAEVIKEKMNGINKEKPLVSSIKRSVLPTLSKVVANIKNIVTRKKNATLTMIERNPLIYLDQVFGDFKTQDLYNALLLDASIGDAAYKSQLKVVQEILEKAEQKVAESFGLKKNETLMSKYKMMTYMIQLEYLSNPDNEQVNEAAKYINETIKFIESSDASRYTDRDVKMLEDILSEFAPNGEVDINKLYATFNSAEKAAIDTIRNLNESLREKAEFTAAIIRGDRISPLNNYVHLNVLQDPTQRDAASSSPSDIANMSNMMNPSTKAKSLIKRTKGAKALNFDIFASAQRGAKFVLMDYNLTSPIRTARITLNNAKKALEVNGRIPKEERDKINALESAFRRAVENLLLNSFTNSSTGEEIIDYISKTGYRAVLAGTTRFTSELMSNIGFALITDPKAMSESVKHMKLMMSEDALLVLQNVLSTQITRIIPTASLSGSMIDTSILRQTGGIRGGRATNAVANRINQLWNRSGKKYVNSVEFVADNLISTADKVIMRPMWFGSFANAFKAETGLSPDFDLIAKNDEAYMSQYKEAINNAKTVADGRVVLTGATDNAFMGVLKGTAKIDDGVTKKAFNNFNNYMTKFLIFEYITARTGINAAMGNGMITRRQGIALIAGVTTRMVVYTFLAQLMGTGLMGLLFGGDDEEEDEKSLAQKFGQQVVSAFTSLMFGRDFGQGVRGILNIGLEEFNKEFLDGLREGEYDPYKDAIQYSIIPPERKGRQTDLGDLFLNMSGSFGPAMKTADFIVRKGFEAPKKEEEAIERTKNEIAIRIPLELAGNAGLIPLYKDVRKVVMNELYKDLRLADKRAADKKRAAEEKLQGYKNSEDMKRYAPELWKETFGPNSAGYDVNEAKKRIKREKAKIERERKDELYNYTPNKRGSKSSFGTQEKRKSSFGSQNKSGARTFGSD